MSNVAAFQEKLYGPNMDKTAIVLMKSQTVKISLTVRNLLYSLKTDDTIKLANLRETFFFSKLSKLSFCYNENVFSKLTGKITWYKKYLMNSGSKILEFLANHSNCFHLNNIIWSDHEYNMYIKFKY